MWALINNYKLILYFAVAVVVSGSIAFGGYKVGVRKSENLFAAEKATIVAEKASLQKELDQKQHTLDLYTADTKRINWQVAENKKRITALNAELSRKNKKVDAVKASSCSSMIRELQEL